MSSGDDLRKLSFVTALCLVVAVAFAAASYTAYKTRIGEWTMLWRSQPLTSLSPHGGHAYVARTGLPELSAHERPSPGRLLENGQVPGRPNSPLPDIRDAGEGRFSFWHDEVYFSASDNSDPRINGRQYSVSYPGVSRPAARTLYAATAFTWVVVTVLAGWLIRRAGARRVMAMTSEAATWLGGRVSTVTFYIFRSRTRRAALGVLAAVWFAVVLLLALSEAVSLTRTAQWTGWWREEAVGPIRHETGFSYIAHTGRPEIGSHNAPAPTALFEDGVQVGLRNALHAEIREVGLGRYSFWHDQVYFSSSDNSDPRTNGRRYTMKFPPVSRVQARILYGLTALAGFLALLVTAEALRSGLLGVRVAKEGERSLAIVLSVAGAGSLVGLAVLRASPSFAPVVSNLWVPVVALNIAAAWAIRAQFGARAPTAISGAFALAMVASFFVLTVWVPQRPQGCHINTPTPAWDMFCTAPDSSSYYYRYVPGSTRNPLYPWFIEGLTAGTGFHPQSYLAQSPPGEPHTDPGDPLMRVVRAQIVLMLLAATVLGLVLIRVLGTPLPAVALVWMYDHQFFTAEELNIVLTEALVQTFQFFLVAAFCLFLWRWRGGLLVLAAAACGAAYLTRQAAGYSALLLGVLWVAAFCRDYRRLWPWCVASIAVFVAFVAVAPVYSYVITGRIGGQDNLQYQYRIAHAMQYATLADLELMPDAESRAWLADAIRRREIEHEEVRTKYPNDEYNQMVYYIAANLYDVATPTTGYDSVRYTPAFFMKVATPILARHWQEYIGFGFRFWQLAMARPGLGRVGLFGFSPWLTYVALGLLALWLWNTHALVGVSLVLAHWAAVAITCLFAVPIPRMVFASDNLVVIAALVLGWGGFERFTESTAGTETGTEMRRWLRTTLAPRPESA